MPYIKVTEDQRRRPRTDEEKARLSIALKGRKLGPYPESRGAAISRAKKGKLTDAMLAANRASGLERRGKHVDNGLRGYKQTPEHVENRIKNQRGRARSIETRQAVSRARKGIQFSDEQKRKLSESAFARHARGDYKAHRSKLELRAGAVLEPLGFTAQFRFDFSSHPFDFCNRATQTIVEINGCYWHAHDCGTCRRMPPNAEAIRQRDGGFEALAAERGFRVVVLWQCQEESWLDILEQEGVVRK